MDIRAMDIREASKRIIVPLDVSTVRQAIKLVEELRDHVGFFKFGFELIFAMLASLATTDTTKASRNFHDIRRLFALVKGRLFLDCKLNDIPNTVGKAVANIVKLSTWAFTFHASMGRKSVIAAVKNARSEITFGVTVLTTMDKNECRSIFGETPGKKVEKFSGGLLKVGAAGVICSPAEAAFLRGVKFKGVPRAGYAKRRKKFTKLRLATPGTRPLWSETNDQDSARLTTPHRAINEIGVDWIVIGRPITNPPKFVGSPAKAAYLVAYEIAVGRSLTKAEAIKVLKSV